MTPVTKPESYETKKFGGQIPFENVSEPGCYLSNWTGHLIRIPDDGLKPGRSPVIEIRGKEQMFVTKISDDPYLTLTKARMIAANLDLLVNF